MILNVYKEKGWTSFDVVAKLRNVLKIRKIGHAGTLDPLAEGVLVVLTEKDTKKQQEVMKAKKEYIAGIAFGATTPTYDLEMPLELSENQITLQELKTKLPLLTKNYIGEIEQTVPPYSAKKVKGTPLYKSARKGQIINNLPITEIEIFDIEIIDYSSYKDLPTAKIKVICSSGTYIRSLAYDLGKDLGVGGVLSSLVRTKVGDYTIEDSKKISEL